MLILVKVILFSVWRGVLRSNYKPIWCANSFFLHWFIYIWRYNPLGFLLLNANTHFAGRTPRCPFPTEELMLYGHVMLYGHSFPRFKEKEHWKWTIKALWWVSVLPRNAITSLLLEVFEHRHLLFVVLYSGHYQAWPSTLMSIESDLVHGWH